MKILRGPKTASLTRHGAAREFETPHGSSLRLVLAEDGEPPAFDSGLTTILVESRWRPPQCPAGGVCDYGENYEDYCNKCQEMR